jgi:hypothetical protein
MAQFYTRPILTDKEKEWVITKAKPLLQQNNISEVRHLLESGTRENLHIKEFLLYRLGEESYFSGEDSFYLEEFAGSSLVEINIPVHIRYIPDFTFEGCKYLRTIRISPNCKRIEINAAACVLSADCNVLVPKNCELIVVILDDDIHEFTWEEFTQMEDFNIWPLSQQIQFY